MDVRQQAPGCFGSPVVFAFDSAVCRDCVAYQACGDESLKTLDEIKTVIDVKDLLAKHERARKKAFADRAPATPAIERPMPTAPVERKTKVEKVIFEIDEEQHQAIMRIGNEKAQRAALILCKSNLIETAKKELAKGNNPFATRPPIFLRVVCDMLLEGKPFDRATLKRQFMERLSWKDGTAASHVSIATSMLIALNVIKETKGTFVLIPAGA